MLDVPYFDTYVGAVPFMHQRHAEHGPLAAMQGAAWIMMGPIIAFRKQMESI